MPEAGGYILPVIIQPLVGGRLPERTEGRDIRPDLYIVESIEIEIFHTGATRIKGRFQFMLLPHISSQPEQGPGVLAFAKEEDAVHPEIIGYKMVYDLLGQRLSNIVLEPGRVAAFAITPAIAYLNCQGNFSGYFLQDHRGLGRHVFNH